MVLLGALQAAWYRRTLNPDGVAYLDLSDRVLAGRWSDLVQGYWSPLYPVMLAAARAVGGHGALHEAAIAHGVNLAGYAFALVGWRLLRRELARRPGGVADPSTPLGVVAGDAVFAWAMLWVASLHFVTPDTWLAGWVFVSAALVLRHGHAGAPMVPVQLGVALGLGYLTKSVLLPVAPFFVAGAVALSPRTMRMRTLTLAGASLLLVAGPWIGAISAREQRFTFGDNGRFNYAWFVSGDRWLSPDPARETGEGSAVFPRVVVAPATYAWPDAPGTYAPWRDPSRWHGAMRPSIDASRQLGAVKRNWNILWFYVVPWCVVLAVLLAAGATIDRLAGHDAIVLSVPSIVALGGYALVFVEGRYVAPFLALLVLVIASALRFSAAGNVRRTALALVMGAAAWWMLRLRIPSGVEWAYGVCGAAMLCWRELRRLSVAAVAVTALITLGGVHVLVRSTGEARRLARGVAAVDPALETRAALKIDGFPEWRVVAVIGNGPTAAVWAREMRARIVAEVPASQAAAFWAASDVERAVVAQAMRDAGAQEIVASGALPPQLPAGWHRALKGSVARYALVAP